MSIKRDFSLATDMKTVRQTKMNIKWTDRTQQLTKTICQVWRRRACVAAFSHLLCIGRQCAAPNSSPAYSSVRYKPFKNLTHMKSILTILFLFILTNLVTAQENEAELIRKSFDSYQAFLFN